MGEMNKKFSYILTQEKFIYPALIVILGCVFFWKILFHPTQMIYGKDTIAGYSHHKFLVSDSLRSTGEFPFWDPFTFSGKPFLGNGQEALYYPPSILFYLLPSDLAFGYSFLLHCLIAGIGVYFLMRVWGLPPFPSFVSALSFMFSLKLMSSLYAGHLPLFVQASWGPWAFLFLELTIRRVSFGYALITGLVLSLAYLAGHIQVLFYLSFLLFLYFVFRVFIFFREGLTVKSFKVTLLFFLIFVTCGALSSVQLLPFLEQIPQMMRSEGVDYKGPSQNHLAAKDLFRVFSPHYRGSPVTVTDGGFVNHLLETELYTGILPLVLSVVAMTRFKADPKIFFWFAMVLFTLFFSLGKHTSFYPLFHSYVPGFGLFKTPTRMLFFYSLSIAILAGFGTGILCSAENVKVRKLLKRVLKGLGILGLVALFVLVFSNNLPPGLPVFFFLLVLSLFLIALILKLDGPQHIGKSLLVLILLVDLWFYGMPFVKTVEPQRVFPETITATFLKKVKGEFRVLDLAHEIPKRLAGRFHIQTLNGHSSSILKHYSEFYGLMWNLPNLAADIYELPRFPVEAIQNRHLLNLLNARFIVTEKPIQIPGIQFVSGGAYRAGSENIGSVYIYENQEVLPRAFVVRNANVLEGKNKIFNALRKFDPKETVILEEKVDRLTHPGKFKEATITSYQPNRIKLSVQLDDPGFLVLGDIWAPGWKAYDHGIKKQVFKANYALRSILLEKGEHQIEFIYDPLSYRIGRMVSLLTVLLLLVYGAFAWRHRALTRSDEKNDEQNW